MKLKIKRSTPRASERQTRHNRDLILFKTASNGFLFEMVDSLRDMGESVVMLNPTDADSLCGSQINTEAPDEELASLSRCILNSEVLIFDDVEEFSEQTRTLVQEVMLHRKWRGTDLPKLRTAVLTFKSHDAKDRNLMKKFCTVSGTNAIEV